MADEEMAAEEMAAEKIADENLPLIFAESIKVEENSELQEEDPFEEVSNYQENSENLQEFESHSMLRADYYTIVGPIEKTTAVRPFEFYSIQVGSNQMPFNAWKPEERNRDRQKNLFTMTSGGFVIVVRNNFH